MSFRRWLSIVFMVLASTAILLVLAALHAVKVVRRPGYALSTGDASVATQDSAFQLRNTPCDVLIYGDSTANVGIDPRLITARTGLSACNIATNRPDVDDLGTLPLDTFLEHNPQPKLIVFQFGPEIFYRSKNPWEHNGPYSPLVMLARDMPTSYALKLMARNPAETTQFALFILQKQLMPGKVDRARLDREFNRMIDHARASHGQLDLGLPALTACHAPPLKLYGPVDSAWIRELHRRYESRGIAVLVRAAPIPACDSQLEQFRQELVPYVDGNVEPLPIGQFVAGERHTTEDGSQADTLGLIALMQRRFPGLAAEKKQIPAE